MNTSNNPPFAISQRSTGMDWLRIFATYLLFVFHVAKAFDPSPFYHIRNAEVSPFFYILSGFIAQWHMPLFFFLAGWSIFHSLKSRTTGEFTKERLLRLGIPLLVGCALFGPLMKYAELKNGLDLYYAGLRMSAEIKASLGNLLTFDVPTLQPFHETFLQFLPTFFTKLERFTWGHLWFIAYLLVLTLAFLPLFGVFMKTKMKVEKISLLWLYAPLAVLFLIQWTMRLRWPGIYNLYNDWANLAYYSVFIWAGFFCARVPAFEKAIQMEWKRALLVGTGAMFVLLAYALQLIKSPAVPLTVTAVAGWSFVLALVGFVQTRTSRPSPFLSYLSESAFPVYILHSPAIIVVGYWLLREPWSIAVKFPILVLGSLVLTLIVHHFAVRPIRVTRFLFGMRAAQCPVKLKLSKALTAILFIALIVSPGFAQQEKLTGALYETCNDPNKILYHWSLTHDPKETFWRSSYTSTNGEASVEDEVLWENGVFKKYSYARHTIQEKSHVLLEGDTLYYTRLFKGKEDHAREKWTSNYTVGPTVYRYIQDHWKALMSGESLPIHYGVLDRMQSYNFSLSLETNSVKPGRGRAVIRMAASNPFVRLAISPIYITFSDDGRFFYGVLGRALPVDVQNGRMRAVNADLRVEKRLTLSREN